MIAPKIEQVSEPEDWSFPSYKTPSVLFATTDGLYLRVCVLCILALFLFLCLPLPLHLKFVEGNMPISWHRYFMFSVLGFQKKKDQDSLLFCSIVVWNRTWGGMSWDTWEVSGADLWTQWDKYILSGTRPRALRTLMEWEEYCTSNVLSLSIKH